MSTYTNNLKMNNGFHADGPFPLDDREVLESVEDLYINESTRNREAADLKKSLFNRVYDGMTVKYKDSSDDRFHIAICENSAPYMPGSELEVNEGNVSEYWTVIF